MEMETIVITEATKEKYSVAASPKQLEDFTAKYAGCAVEQLIMFYYMRTRTCKVFMQHTEDAREVIDLIAEELDLVDKGHYLYGPVDGQTPIVEKIRQYLDRGGEKVKLKKRVDELENENRILRSLVGK